MAKYGDVISAADFNNLKSVVDKEIERRSQPNSNGTMKNYTTSQYQYNDKPALGVPIKDEHIYKITIPLDAVNNGSITPQNGGYINAAYIINATTVASNLASKDVKASKKNTGCNANCTGLCYSGCYTVCGGSCTGDCSGYCTGSCSGDCDTGCEGDCSGGCKDTCTASCTSCSGHCGDNACQATCYLSCSGKTLVN